MVKATLKSLLGRKLRLLMSTFAIVLGVAFVGGSLIFSDTLGRSFTALFASTVGDVVVRPADGITNGAPSSVAIPASVVTDLQSVPGAARVDGNVTAFGVYVVDQDNKVVGGRARRPSAAATPTPPPGTGCPASPSSRAGRRTDLTRSSSTPRRPSAPATSSARTCTSSPPPTRPC